MPLAHIAQIIKHFLPEPIGSPLVRVLFTNVHSVVAVDASEVKARAAELLGQHQQIKHFGARRRVFASVRFEPAPVVMGDGLGRCRRRPRPPRPTTRRRYRPRSPMPRTIPDPCRAATANQTTAPGVVTYQRMPESQRIAGARS